MAPNTKFTYLKIKKYDTYHQMRQELWPRSYGSFQHFLAKRKIILGIVWKEFYRAIGLVFYIAEVGLEHNRG